MSLYKQFVKKVGACSLCEYEGEQTHLRHIIARSLGGGDIPENLLELCIVCHSKAHGVSCRGDSGLIQKGIDDSKTNLMTAKEWLDVHEVVITRFIEDFGEHIESRVLEDLLYFECIKINELHTWMKFGKGERTRTFGEVPLLVHSFLMDNIQNYQIDLTDNFSKTIN